MAINAREYDFFDNIDGIFVVFNVVIIGVDKAKLLKGLADPNTDEDTRVSWKFACSRKTLAICRLLPIQCVYGADQ